MPRSQNLFYATNGSGVYGHKDTPKLPWCEYVVHDPDRPRRNASIPARPAASPAPADAIVLFDGKDVSQWRSNSYRVVDGCLEAAGNVSPRTKESFGSFQLHVEWMSPANYDGPWYNRGNNGVSIHGLYEIQIFDSFNEKWAPDGQCAAVYGQTPPLVNACRAPGEWQSYDIAFTAPVLDGEKVSACAHHDVSQRRARASEPGNLRRHEPSPVAASGENCARSHRARRSRLPGAIQEHLDSEGAVMFSS